jgi:Ca2+-transporting ATPase
VARADFQSAELPASQHDFKFNFLGIIAMADPLREDTAGAIKECHNAGIRVIMITGDHPITAKSIGEQIYLKNCRTIITGQELENIPATKLKDIIKNTNIFARISPEQKLLIVNNLKNSGEVVAMTGDGVNDAPALKAADIGVAMGERGTDVAREAASIILLKDNFSAIVAAVREGRKIFDNLKKSISYLISVHTPTAGIALLGAILGWPMMFYPVHIVFLELIIDPACSIVFQYERSDKNIMNRNPRDPRSSLFGNNFIKMSFMQGIFYFLTVAILYWAYLYYGASTETSRTVAFATLVLSNLGLILIDHPWFSKEILTIKNKAFCWISGITLLSLIAIIYQPNLQKIFYFHS